MDIHYDVCGNVDKVVEGASMTMEDLSTLPDKEVENANLPEENEVHTSLIEIDRQCALAGTCNQSKDDMPLDNPEQLFNVKGDNGNNLDPISSENVHISDSKKSSEPENKINEVCENAEPETFACVEKISNDRVEFCHTDVLEDGSSKADEIHPIEQTICDNTSEENRASDPLQLNDFSVNSVAIVPQDLSAVFEEEQEKTNAPMNETKTISLIHHDSGGLTNSNEADALEEIKLDLSNAGGTIENLEIEIKKREVSDSINVIGTCLAVENSSGDHNVKLQISNCSSETKSVFNNLELLAILEGDDDDPRDVNVHDKKTPLKRKSAGKSSSKPEKVRSSDTKGKESDLYSDDLAVNKPAVIRSYSRKSSKLLVTDIVADWSEVEILEDELLEEELTKQRNAEIETVTQLKLSKSEKKKKLKKELVLNNERIDNVNDGRLKDSFSKHDHKEKGKDVAAQDSVREIAKQIDDEVNIVKKENDNAIIQVDANGKDDNAGRRRMSRVIKKKIIWDPDNPETYKFASAALRKSQSGPPLQVDDEVTIKNEGAPSSPKDQNIPENQIEHPKSKLIKKKIVKKPPLKKIGSISHWKKQNMTDKLKAKIGLKKKKTQNFTSLTVKKKKMTEIDRLLMDEGAVNMIYQLEKSSNKKDTRDDDSPPNSPLNISSKAEMIKKAVISQSTTSTPETPAKTFRKREVVKVKTVSGTPVPKKTSSRLTKSSSSRDTVKSPSLFEEYATRNAESSIIVRRHSSSSYSSSCMSPRRLSDIENAAVAAVGLPNHAEEGSLAFLSPKPKGNIKQKKRSSNANGNTDFLKVIKENNIEDERKTLKSKVAQVFSLKRKKSIMRPASKVKKLTPSRTSKSDESSDTLMLLTLSDVYTQLAIEYEDNVAQITVNPTESKTCLYNLQVLLELRRAISAVSRGDKSRVTLLCSRDGSLCGGLDPRTLYTHRQERKTRVLEQVASAWCDLVLAMSSHQSGLIGGIDGTCSGIGAALLPLCDAVLASDQTTIRLPGCGANLQQPGLAVLSVHPRAPHHSIVAIGALSGQPLTAAEALSRGFISRTLWPHRFQQELHTIVAAIAANPLSSLQLTKRLLCVSDVSDILRPALVTEKKLLVEYWSSQEGQSAIRAAVETVDVSAQNEA